VVKNTWCGVDEGKKHGVKLENASIFKFCLMFFSTCALFNNGKRK
jgi:hypothetical protein